MKKIILTIITILLFLSPKAYAKGFGVGHNKKGERPNINEPIITNNNGYYIGENEKVVYLTFDCGYENGYTEEILNILKEEDVPAAFFITGHYLKSSSDLVKRMYMDGHIIGNHTYSHKDFTKSTNEEILNDIKKLENAYYDEIGVPMQKYVRPPRGEYSLESQRLLAQNGYKSIFWSLAYVDWDKDKFNGSGYSFNKVMNRIHNGAIILMHSVSKDNLVDLKPIIEKLKDDGYTFKSIDTL